MQHILNTQEFKTKRSRNTKECLKMTQGSAFKKEQKEHYQHTYGKQCALG